MTNSLTPDQIDALVAKVGGASTVRDILSGMLDLRILPLAREATAQSAPLSVPDGPDYEARIAGGAFGWRNADVTEAHFPVTDDQFGVWEPHLFHFARSLSSDDAARLIREAGFEPARIAHILAFAKACPDTQRRHPVVGLGSPADVDGKGSVPSLWFDGDERTLDIIWLDGDWHRNYRFLGVRRVAS